MNNFTYLTVDSKYCLLLPSFIIRVDIIKPLKIERAETYQWSLNTNINGLSSSESNVRSFNLGGIFSRISLSEKLWERPWSFEMSGFSVKSHNCYILSCCFPSFGFVFPHHSVAIAGALMCLTFSWTVSLIPSITMETIFFSSVGSNLNDVSSWSNWTCLKKVRSWNLYHIFYKKNVSLHR